MKYKTVRVSLEAHEILVGAQKAIEKVLGRKPTLSDSLEMLGKWAAEGRAHQAATAEMALGLAMTINAAICFAQEPQLLRNDGGKKLFFSEDHDVVLVQDDDGKSVTIPVSAWSSDPAVQDLGRKLATGEVPIVPTRTPETDALQAPLQLMAETLGMPEA